MMKITLINGSPKIKDSASGAVLDELKDYLKDNDIQEYSFRRPELPKELDLNELEKQEAIVFSFPLYVDGVPSHLLNCLSQLERFFADKSADIIVYTIVNCGFYEGIQNRHAIGMIKNWCKKANVKFGQGVGIGAGGMLVGLKNAPNGKGLKKNTSSALNELSNNIINKKIEKDLFVSPNFPRLLYKFGAEMGWRHQIKENGLKTKDLFRQIK